jgi:probable F420-dependent oxidoreductase
MATIDLGPVGIVLGPDPEGQFVSVAAEVERAGFSTVWLTGGPMSSLDQVRDVVAATSTIKVATGIIAVDRFPSDDVAELYLDLTESAPGRFVVGLGGAHGAKPIETIAAYLDRLDSVVPQSQRVLAALGPRMLDLASSRAAGALPVLITTEYAATAKARLGETTLAVEQMVVLDPDPTSARRLARVPLGFLGSLPGYQASFRRMGLSDDDIASISDGLVDALVAWGEVGAIAARVDALRAAGADHVALSVLSESGHVTPEQLAQLASALLSGS